MEPSQRISCTAYKYDAILEPAFTEPGIPLLVRFLTLVLKILALLKSEEKDWRSMYSKKSIMRVGYFLKFVLLICNKLQFSRLSSTNVFFSFTNFEALFTKFTLFSVTIFTTCRKENCLDVNKLARPESLIRGYLEWQRLVRADYLLQVVNQVQIILLCVELGTYTSLVQNLCS